MGKGYPAEAARALFERAEANAGDYQLFVFHDADLDGYNIARTLREATRRMPGYSVDVVDLGLTVEDAVEMDLAPEPFHRRKDISDALYASLSETAREYLYRRNGYRRGVSGERFELNAILPVSSRIEYIERKLEENGVRGKLIPPGDELKRLAEDMYRRLHAGLVDDAIARIVDTESIKESLADSFIEEFSLERARDYIEEAFEKDDSLPWRKALEDRLASRSKDHERDLEEALREKIGEAMKGGR
jgi:GNAT superfamily N-acetyltransferase